MTTPSTVFTRTDTLCRIIQKSTNLSAEEQEQTILEVLRYVGFKATHINLGVSKGNFIDEDGRYTGETFDLNDVSQIKILNQDDENQVAEIWLNNLWRVITPNGSNGYYLSRLTPEGIVSALSEAIEKSVQLKPIVLTKYGETLREYPTDNGNHTRDEQKLSSVVGVHDGCGWVDLKSVSQTHQIILCRACGLRVVIPKSLITYGDLREHFESFQPE